MEAILHKRIIRISLAVVILSPILIIVTTIVDPKIELFILVLFLLIYALLAIISAFAIKYINKEWLKKSTKYSLFLLPVILIPVFIFLAKGGNFPLVFWILIGLTIILSVLILIRLFLYANATTLTPIILFMVLVVLGIFFKRQHWPLAGLLIIISSFVLSAGSFIYGIRCLYIAEKNIYFRNLTFLGNFALSLAFLGQMFKMQHWVGGGVMAIASSISLTVGTLYVLITLHSSGYVDWQPYFKKIFRRILIPWTFIFLLYISRFMVPELNALVFTSDPGKGQKRISPYVFGMKDYTIEEKTGEDAQ